MYNVCKRVGGVCARIGAPESGLELVYLPPHDKFTTVCTTRRQTEILLTMIIRVFEKKKIEIKLDGNHCVLVFNTVCIILSCLVRVVVVGGGGGGGVGETRDFAFLISARASFV